MDISDYRKHIKDMRANNIRNYVNRSNAIASGEKTYGAGALRMDSLPKPTQGIQQPSLVPSNSALNNELSGMMPYRTGRKPRGAGIKMPKIPKSISKITDKLLDKGTKVVGKSASNAFDNYMSQQFEDGGRMRKPRMKPNERGGKFDFVKAIKSVGHDVGKPFSAVGVNPFDLGYTMGHDYVSPYIVDPLKKQMGGTK